MRTLALDEARRHLLAACGLGPRTDTAPDALLAERRCIQLDPLDPVGANADLVAMARTSLPEGGLEAGVLPGRAFEHFAKERCLLPAEAWPVWRDRARATPWWRTTERMRRLDDALLDDVLSEVRDRGPVDVPDLSDRGRVEPLDWSGWKGTAKATTLAVEVLWLRCQVVVVGRGPRRIDLPERALPDRHDAAAPADPDAWMLRERVAAMGLLPSAKGPCWGQLQEVRTTLPERLVEAGELQWVTLPGTRRRWLAPAEILAGDAVDDDGPMRILGPLDPVLWDRDLVGRAFGFDYTWEVYTPAAKRRFGWYTCPLLHRGRLVGRFEGRRRDDGSIEVLGLWPEAGFEREAFDACLADHGARLRPRRGRSG